MGMFRVGKVSVVPFEANRRDRSIAMGFAPGKDWE